MEEQLELMPNEWGRCPYCGSTNLKVKPVWKTYHFVACQYCKSGGPIAKTEEEAFEAFRRRYTPTTRRVTKGDGATHFSWCEAGGHPMNATGEFCVHCGARVIEG